MRHDTLVILGFGYTARFILSGGSHRYARIVATSRRPDAHLSRVAPDRRIAFDLGQPLTWDSIPNDADLLWCFPAAPVELVKEFAATIEAGERRMVVLGSTSAYNLQDSRDYPPRWIDEAAPIDGTQPRVQGEEYLRTEHKAILLRVAGIYGPDRNPIEWIKAGRVGPSRKYVNLIHAEDLAASCLAALEHGTPGEAYNVSDGTPRTWQDICDRVHARWGVTSPKPSPSPETGKRISNAKLIKQLGYTIQHSDLFHELSCLI
jgi:hypothetical protein